MILQASGDWARSFFLAKIRNSARNLNDEAFGFLAITPSKKQRCSCLRLLRLHRRHLDLRRLIVHVQRPVLRRDEYRPPLPPTPIPPPVCLLLGMLTERETWPT